MVTLRLDSERWLLTTESPGTQERPVLLHRGRAYPPDHLNGLAANRVAAWAYVQLRARADDHLDTEISLVRAYLSQWPDGPQLIPAELGKHEGRL